MKYKEVKFTKPKKPINLSQLSSEIQIELNLSKVSIDNPNGEFAGLSMGGDYIWAIVQDNVLVAKDKIANILKKHIAQPTEREEIKQRFNSKKLEDKINAIAEFVGLKEP